MNASVLSIAFDHGPSTTVTNTTSVWMSNPTLWTLLAALRKDKTITLANKVNMMSMGEGPEPKSKIRDSIMINEVTSLK